MFFKTTFTLSTVLNTTAFSSLTNALGIPVNQDGEYIDNTKKHKGMVVAYHAGQYKKRISVFFELPILLSHDSTPDSIPKKIRQRLQKYFREQLPELDFFLSSASIAVNLNVGTPDTVADYMTVLRRIGRVKNYTLKSDCGIGGTPSYLLWLGNSNATALRLYELEDGPRTVAGILRAEVQLLKNKAIRNHTKTEDPKDQMIELAEEAEHIFLRVFAAVIPYGVFLKQQGAVHLIQTKVSDRRLREKMWRLVALVPDKKSLLGALKAAGCRDTHTLMEAFADIDLSPVTIAKRHHCTQLPNLYDFLPLD